MPKLRNLVWVLVLAVSALHMKCRPGCAASPLSLPPNPCAWDVPSQLGWALQPWRCLMWVLGMEPWAVLWHPQQPRDTTGGAWCRCENSICTDPASVSQARVILQLQAPTYEDSAGCSALAWGAFLSQPFPGEKMVAARNAFLVYQWRGTCIEEQSVIALVQSWFW